MVAARLLVLLAVLAAPFAAEAQRASKMPVVGVLHSGAGPRSATVDITRQGLRDLGYVDGQTIAFEIRSKTAKAFGLTIPPALFLRADQVIE